MNYAQKVLFGKLRELQDGRRRHNYFAATSEEKHWDNEFALIKAIKILSVPSHETPKVITNEKAKEVCCKNCEYVLNPHNGHPCYKCIDYDQFKQIG